MHYISNEKVYTCTKYMVMYVTISGRS